MLTHINTICLHISEKSCTFVVEKERDIMRHYFWQKSRHPETLNYLLYKIDPTTRTPELLTIFSDNDFNFVAQNLLILTERNPNNTYFIYDQLQQELVTKDNF